MKCSNCGSNLEIKKNSPFAKCGYCDATTPLVSEETIAKVMTSKIDGKFTRAKMLIEQHSFAEALKVLNEIIDEDETQARAWYLKSQLPILENPSILFEGICINLHSYSKLKGKDEMARYLTNCGLSTKRHRAFAVFYDSTDFLYEQQILFIEKSIEHAEEKSLALYQSEKKVIEKNKNSKGRKQRFIVQR